MNTLWYNLIQHLHNVNKGLQPLTVLVVTACITYLLLQTSIGSSSILFNGSRPSWLSNDALSSIDFFLNFQLRQIYLQWVNSRNCSLDNILISNQPVTCKILSISHVKHATCFVIKYPVSSLHWCFSASNILFYHLWDILMIQWHILFLGIQQQHTF